MVCLNARLGGAASHPANPDGQTNGQGGWDIGVQFANLTDLAAQLEQLLVTLPRHMCWPSWQSVPHWSCNPVGKVTQLAINAHGTPGRIYTGGQPDYTGGIPDGYEGHMPAEEFFDLRAEHLAISVRNLRSVAGDLLRIRDATEVGSTIFLMGCMAGQGPEGAQLLKMLSQCLPDRRIVAFTTVGLLDDNMLRPGQGCTEPGMRDTLHVNESAKGQRPDGKLWNNLNLLPWASETSPGAKIALNGQIIRQPPIDVGP
jgi:hypothetical protein